MMAGMGTRRDFLRTGARAVNAAAVGAVATLSAASGTQGGGAATFSSVDELMRFHYAARTAAHLLRALRSPNRYKSPLSPERRAAMMDEYTARNRQQFEYKMMRLNQPDIVDCPETLAEVARRLGVPVEQVTNSLPWHNLPDERFIVLPLDGGFPTTTDSVVMLYVASTRTFWGY
jgi:hypothetical protein